MAIHLPSKHTTVVVLINTNAGGAPLLPLAQAITRIISPNHVYEYSYTPL